MLQWQGHDHGECRHEYKLIFLVKLTIQRLEFKFKFKGEQFREQGVLGKAVKGLDTS